MKRKFYSGEITHIYQRTVSGFNIFYCAEDFLVFYTIVSVYAHKYDIVLLGLCQMIDHIHLLGSSRNLESMSRFISAYTSRFAKEFNRRTGRTGHLFEKEYGSAIKRETKKVRSAIAYLFNNPVEKMLCERAEEYRWNYLEYYGKVSLKPLRQCSWKLQKSIKIKLYFPFDVKKVTRYYKSHADMLTAINSNTGSEHDIMEHSYCKTDVPYREIMVILKKEEITDIRSVIMWREEDKKRIASLLKSRTSATHRQIRKFLHIEQ